MKISKYTSIYKYNECDKRNHLFQAYYFFILQHVHLHLFFRLIALHIPAQCIKPEKNIVLTFFRCLSRCRSPPLCFGFFKKNQNGGLYIKRINLREHYPFYEYDFYIEVTDKLAELLILFNRKTHADNERRRVYRAYYSLDVDDGIERDFTLLVMSTEEIYQRKMSYKELYAAINSLPEIRQNVFMLISFLA
jgi:hypothetical protein